MTASAGSAMKKELMSVPATAAENMETKIAVTSVVFGLLKDLAYVPFLKKCQRPLV